MRRLRPQLLRLARFSGVGLTCFAIQAGILLALERPGVPGPAANAVGFLASAQVNFLLSTYVTWADRRRPRTEPWGRRWLSFQATVAVSLACNTGVYALVSGFLPPVAAAAAGVCAGALLTYLASDHLVFRRRRAERTDHYGDSIDDHRPPAAALPGPDGGAAAAD
ncbi:GtrA family protein [Glycomyces terrestris]|uniref:GtrA family protein n=1 Tax=Glycomyces terrestris TaxID=2493553 RepID=A0A426UTT8_9ACTN|nr:GtrA family protein [Glycomyces terrestris]RRR97392.1 GtrA family protein [Glycomyces terrestris]